MAANKVVYRKTSDFNVMELGRYQILIDKRFVLVGDMESSRERHGVSSVSSTNEKTTRYIFADVSDGKTNVKKLVAIYESMIYSSYNLGGIIEMNHHTANTRNHILIKV
jgi:hypothetical protein